MGLAGLEPATKGFTWPVVSGGSRTISSPTSAAAREGAGRSCLSSRALQPSGSLCTFRRCTAGLAQGCHRSRDRKGSLNSSRPLRGFHREGTFVDESPALTIVLQAQRAAILADARARRHFCSEFSRLHCMCNRKARSRAKARPTAHEAGVGGVRGNFFASGAKFSRLLLDNACDASHEKNSENFCAARRYPQKRWKTSG